MINISIITFCTGGRPTYLINCLDSIYCDVNSSVDNKIIVEHHLVFQGKGKEEIDSFLSYFKPTNLYKLIVHEFPENIGIGSGLNKILPECKGNLVFKADDDCKIISSNFFDKAYALHQRFPNSCFSPFVVGLIRNVGGATGFKHSVWCDKQNNNVYTRRHTTHLGGISRFSPAHIIKNFTFQNDLIKGISGVEDTDFSQYCNNKKIEMFYLENDLIVQHADSTLGQIVRYPDYFKDRKYEGSLKIEVVE